MANVRAAAGAGGRRRNRLRGTREGLGTAALLWGAKTRYEHCFSTKNYALADRRVARYAGA
ncbi:hypothetical protein KCP77_01570 [Salmonella enterica subsp. enterica]|nr:hypothetical protein KCP77_01570 [Salmonella enterica subsp. enterica]